MIREISAAALCAAVAAGCATSQPARPLIESRTVEVPVSVPVPVSPTLTAAPPAPTLPEGRLTNEDLAQHIQALRSHACHLRAKLADIARIHGNGTQTVECED
jgi:hypothetical protein